MITYKQFLLENSKGITATDSFTTAAGFLVEKGDVYYMNQEGQLDRGDGPAVITPDYEFWFKNGKFHRDGEPAVFRKNGSYNAWWNNGKRHRLDGPAFMGRDPDSYMWYIDDDHLTRSHISNEDKWLLLKANIPNNFPFLNGVDMTTEMQEYVIQHRPDLINKIQDLDPALKRKYAHESEFGKLDL